MKKVITSFVMFSFLFLSAAPLLCAEESPQEVHYHQVHNHLFQEVSKWVQMYYDHVAQINLIMKKEYDSAKGDFKMTPLTKNEAYYYVKNRLDFFYNQAHYFSSFSKDFGKLMTLIKDYIDKMWYI